MGGFKWCMTVSDEEGNAMESVIEDLNVLARDADNPYTRYFARKLLSMWVVKPEQQRETCWWEVKQTLFGKVEIPKETYAQFFGKEFSVKGKALLWCFEIPWLWKFPATVLAQVVACFERYGVASIWWVIVGDYSRVDDAMDKFWDEHAEEVFGKGVELDKIKPDSE